MPFTPQTMLWPGTRAVLLVHGIGDASAGQDGAFPLDALRTALGNDAADLAIYRINYDFINDWIATKVQFQAGITRFKEALRIKLGNEGTDAAIAEYAGDVLWPIFSLDIRFAIRDALVAQLNRILIDRDQSARARGQDPLDYQVSLIAHSLGCLHTYELLWAAAREAAYHLRPRSDHVTFDSIILMASPVRLIRFVAGKVGATVPERTGLAALGQPLAIPCEGSGGSLVPCTRDFYSITGSCDPVGGFLLGKKLNWAYMDIPGQHSVVVSQHLLGIDTKAGTAQALTHGGVTLENPHSWSAYIQSQAKLLRGLLLT